MGALEPAISAVLVVCWWRDWDEEETVGYRSISTVHCVVWWNWRGQNGETLGVIYYLRALGTRAF